MAEDQTRTTELEGASATESAVTLLSPPGYELGDEIGRGGMGVVYRARDRALDREVAIKLLSERYSADSPMAGRFLNEARITGQLQHPGIPAVHQVGALADGRPFLAMKLIKGSTLESILKRKTGGRGGVFDTPAEASEDSSPGHFLAIFEAVCQAVGYAHAHRVIHRDLKPSNVMVGAFGEVQVMDWGLAKVLGQETPATEEALASEPTRAWTQVSPTPVTGHHTQAGSLVGTPAFIPPEQAVGQIGRVNERSDVFGLGAVLAVILTGQPPYVGDSFETVRIQAVRGKLEDCLTRLDASGAEPELVALCKKCLAFEPSERPADAGTVAQAVAGLRSAADDRARAAERLQAAAEARAAEQRRKRRWQLAAATAVVLALLAGVAGLAAYLQAQKQANSELRAANEREHQRFEVALDAIKTLHTGVSEDALLKEEEFKDLRERLLREAAKFYGKLQGMLQDQPDPSSQRALAESYSLLADLTFKIGSPDESLALRRKALALRRELASRGEPGAELEVARSLLALSGSLTDRFEYANAKTAAQEARGLAEAAGPSDEALNVLADSLTYVGFLCDQMGEVKEALRHAELALEIGQKQVDGNPDDASLREKLATAQLSVGLYLDDLGRYPESVQASQKAIEIFEKEARANPAAASVQDNLARCHVNKGDALVHMGSLKEAVSECAKAVEAEQKAIDANPAVSAYKNNQAWFNIGLGDALEQLGAHEEALQAYRNAAKTLKPLAEAHPTDVYYRANLAKSHTRIGSVLLVLARPAEALQALDQGMLLYRKLADEQPARYQPSVAWIARKRGFALQKLARPGEAVATNREAITILEGVAKPVPGDLYSLACSYALKHALALEKGSGLTTADAPAAADQAITTLRRAIAAGYRDLDNLRKDTDLDSLRQHPAFQKSLEELEKDIKARGK
jgi:serine/threonine protein kinase/tetratricopeptide (TPR) repeat protein